MIKVTITDPYGEIVGDIYVKANSKKEVQERFKPLFNLISVAKGHFEIHDLYSEPISRDPNSGNDFNECTSKSESDLDERDR